MTQYRLAPTEHLVVHAVVVDGWNRHGGSGKAYSPAAGCQNGGHFPRRRDQRGIESEDVPDCAVDGAIAASISGLLPSVARRVNARHDRAERLSMPMPNPRDQRMVPAMEPAAGQRSVAAAPGYRVAILRNISAWKARCTRFSVSASGRPSLRPIANSNAIKPAATVRRAETADTWTQPRDQRRCSRWEHHGETGAGYEGRSRSPCAARNSALSERELGHLAARASTNTPGRRPADADQQHDVREVSWRTRAPHVPRRFCRVGQRPASARPVGGPVRPSRRGRAWLPSRVPGHRPKLEPAASSPQSAGLRGRVPTSWIVEPLHVSNTSALRFVPSPVHLSMHSLQSWAREEALHRRVVPDVA